MGIDGEMRTGNHRTAYIRYSGGIQGEEHVDSSGDGILPVRLGSHRLPPGIEQAVETMAVGEKRSVVVPPELGYGKPDPKLVKWYPRSVLDHGYEIRNGSMIMWESADGLAKKPAMVVDATEDAVKIDMNHPFAGKTLEYDIELVELK